MRTVLTVFVALSFGLTLMAALNADKHATGLRQTEWQGTGGGGIM